MIWKGPSILSFEICEGATQISDKIGHLMDRHAARIELNPVDASRPTFTLFREG